MLVKSWLSDFLRDCQIAHPDAVWDSESRVWSEWLGALKDPNPSPVEARLALGHVGERQIRVDSGQSLLVEILRQLDEMRRKPSVLSADRDSAARESAGCPFCGGDGMAHVYHPAYTGNPVVVVDGRQAPARVLAYCVCKLGDWMRSRTVAEINKRTPNLKDCLEGKSLYIADDPIAPDPDDFEPMPWREMAARLAEQMAVSRTH